MYFKVYFCDENPLAEADLWVRLLLNSRGFGALIGKDFDHNSVNKQGDVLTEQD